MSRQDSIEQLMKRDFQNPNETGWQRLQRFFRDVVQGEDRAEVDGVKFVSAASAAFGAAYGGILRNQKLQEDFIRRHNHRVFLGVKDAQRMYIDYLSMYALRSAVSYGLRCGAFGACVGTQLVCSTIYRDDLRVTDMAVGVGLVTATTRYSMGLKAAGAAFLVGAFLGTCAGLLSKGFLLVSGVTVHDLLYWANHDHYFERMATRRDRSCGEENAFVAKQLQSRPKRSGLE